ncbi:hypothetical protein ACUHGC_05305 [Testudinibacter sp. P27/CKL/0425]
MSFFKYYTKQKLAKEFTHYGKLFGVPVYVDMRTEPGPVVETANFIPDWVLDIAEPTYFFIESLMNFNDESYEPMYWIKLIKRTTPCDCKNCTDKDKNE